MGWLTPSSVVGKVTLASVGVGITGVVCIVLVGPDSPIGRVLWAVVLVTIVLTALTTVIGARRSAAHAPKKPTWVHYAFGLGAVGFGLYQLYSAVTRHEVIGKHNNPVSWEAEPVAFVLAILPWLLLALFTVLLCVLALFAKRIGAARDRRNYRWRPPLTPTDSDKNMVLRRGRPDA